MQYETLQGSVAYRLGYGTIAASEKCLPFTSAEAERQLFKMDR